MRFATRTFLWTFVPFALLLMGSFWAIQSMVISSVRRELLASLRQTQTTMASLESQSQLQNSRFLHLVAENATLKAGLQLNLAERGDASARRTLEDQLREIARLMRFDLLMASTVEGSPLAGVLRVGDQWVNLDLTRLKPPRRGFFDAGDTTYQIASVAVDQGDEALGVLSIGDRFDFQRFPTLAVLTRGSRVLKSNLPDVSVKELEAALAQCPQAAECQLAVNGRSYISLAMNNLDFGDGYMLRSLQSVDAASGPIQGILRSVFLVSGLAALLAAGLVALFSTRSVVRPLADVVARLRASSRTGQLPEFEACAAPVEEIRELTESFNHAADVIREGQAELREAYVGFVGSLAQALDARDRYTAGHSRRVSQRAVSIAQAMNLTEADIGDISIGALLHDIGKIGIADRVLQKPGRLTQEEFALIQQHPTIGRRILEGVQGFRPYLPVVELHHENWDGSGYPLALRGTSVPLAARIVHVVDAYDAMTSDRPYRPGMSHEEASAILNKFAGSQFDPEVVRVFQQLPVEAQLRPEPHAEPAREDLQRLAEALGPESAIPILPDMP
jgi:HD-GYP domain-containing protein (c-di-GMP phosphodiesterase class II)